MFLTVFRGRSASAQAEASHNQKSGEKWSLTYVATPIAVAVSEALFTNSGLPIQLVEVCSHLSSVQLCYVMFS